MSFSCIIWFIVVIVIGEAVIHVLFYILGRLFGKEDSNKLDARSVFKGLLERSFLTLSLVVGIQSALILFGALKIATRIKDDTNKISNDFFLVGNISSVLFSVCYYLFFNYLFS